MVTQTTAPPTRKSRKKNQAESPPVDETVAADDAGGQPSTDSETDVDRLSARLKSFGFDVPIALIGQWDGPTFTNIELTASRWQNEFDRANQHEAIPEAERTPLPPLLATMEAVTPDLAKLAQDAGTVSAGVGHTADFNLYPPGSGLAKIWLEALTSAKPAEETKPADAPAAIAAPAEPTKGSPPDLTKPANAAELNAKREAGQKADRARQQQLAIESAQHDMEEAVTHQEELAEQIVDMKAEMKELKSAYDNAVVRGQKAAKALRRARAGSFERTLPFPKAHADDALNVPDQDIGDRAAPAAPAKPKVDEGAFVSLDHLVKGDLQEFIMGTPEDRGLSDKQVEKLKEAIGGDTIGKLEEFQRNKGEWWTKEISGFGKETITKLQDAHEIIRRKFPVPELGETEDVPEPAADAAPVLDVDEALKRLEALTTTADALSNHVESDGGVEFLQSVYEKAGAVLVTIRDSGKVTPDQTRAIVNWEDGVAKWDKGDPVSATEDDDGEDFADGLDDDEDELDVLDADDEGDDD